MVLGLVLEFDKEVEAEEEEGGRGSGTARDGSRFGRGRVKSGRRRERFDVEDGGGGFIDRFD